MKISIAQTNPIVGDIVGNTENIIQHIALARRAEAEIILFPELAICGYPPEDLLLLPQFIQSIQDHLNKIIAVSENISVVVGLPRQNTTKKEKLLYNSAAIISNGQLLGYYDKILLPTYDVFDERRYFEPGRKVTLWPLGKYKVGVIICEDIWQHRSSGGFMVHTDYERDPVAELLPHRPDLVLNLSASPFSINKPRARMRVCVEAATTLNCPVVLCNQVGGNDSLIFDGYSIAVNGNGELVATTKGFQEDNLIFDLESPPDEVHLSAELFMNRNIIRDLYAALTLGVKDYFNKQKFTKACFGLSGGIDSAVVGCIAVAALGAENVLGVMMPSKFTTHGSIEDAEALAKNLGIEYKQISIEPVMETYLNVLNPHFNGKNSDATEENLQARIRGMILMALSNKWGYIVLSTGNKSEMAMGYSTLYGDMCGGLGVISDVTKKNVYHLARWINHEKEIIPLNTISKPPSAELRPNQKDSDSLPDYDIVDDVLQSYVEEHQSAEEIAKGHNYELALVQDLIYRIHASEYKRRQSPPGLRVSEKAFSTGRRFPIVQGWVKVNKMNKE